jgi:hypothetical protein
MIQGSYDQQLLEIALAAGSASRHKADLEEAGLDARELEKPTAGELEVTRPQREASAGRVRPCAESGR